MTKGSPTRGTPSQPVMCTGLEKLASVIFLPRKFSMRRTGERAVPHTTHIPDDNVPSLITRVAEMPFFASRSVSITKPSAGFCFEPVSPEISAVRMSMSSSSGIPTPVFAEMGTYETSPP